MHVNISVLITTYNMLDALEIALDSIFKNSDTTPEVCICDDGSTDGTRDYLLGLDREVKFTCREHRGCFSGWNAAGKLATGTHVFISQDDFYHCPHWDTALAREIEHGSPDDVFGPNIVEEAVGSYHYFAGGAIADNKPFQEAKVNEYVKQFSPGKFLQVMGPCTFTKGEWDLLGGFDERYDPCCGGEREILMRLAKIKPRNFYLVNDCPIYHLRAQMGKWKIGATTLHNTAITNTKRFIADFGISIADSVAFLNQKRSVK